MAKYTPLDDVNNLSGNPTSAQATINTNNDRIESAFDNTLSRDGSTPNTMSADIDLNSNDLLNVNITDTTTLKIGGSIVDTSPLTVNDANQINYDQGGTGSVATTVEAKLQEFVSVKDFGATGDGITDDTTALTTAISSANGKVLWFEHGKTYLTGDLTIAGGSNIPVGVMGNGAQLQAKAGTTTLLTIENPQVSTTDPINFFIENLKLDGDDKAQDCLRIHGSQYCRYNNIQCRKATRYGVFRDAASGYGIYYNNFDILCEYNGSHGFYSETSDAAYRIASNFVRLVTNQNKGHGAYSNYDQDDYILSAENNDTYAHYIDYTRNINILGGYSEGNHQNYATDLVSDGGTDESFFLTANAIGVKLRGGRHIGEVSGTLTNAGFEYMPTNKNRVIVPPTTYEGALTFNSDITTNNIIGPITEQSGVSINDATTYDVTALRADAGTNTTYLATLSVDGNSMHEMALIRCPGAAGNIVVTSISAVSSPPTWTTDNSKIQINNATGSARTVRYNLLRLN